MIEKALIIMIFMYATSFGVLGAQYIADIFNVSIVNYEGVPVRSALLSVIESDTLNTFANNTITTNSTAEPTDFDRVVESTQAAAFTVWELITLMSGTYIFNFLFLMGVPGVIVGGMVVLYVILLARAIIGWLRPN